MPLPLIDINGGSGCFLMCSTAKEVAMHNLIHYKEHYGKISFSMSDNQFSSSVKGAKAGNNISVKGSSEEEVKKAFKDYIDELSSKNNIKKG